VFHSIFKQTNLISRETVLVYKPSYSFSRLQTLTQETKLKGIEKYLLWTRK